MNELVSLEVNHGYVKYDSIEIFDKLKQMIQYLERLPNVVVESTQWNATPEDLYRSKAVEVYDQSEPYVVTERKFLKEKMVKKIDKERMGKIYFSNKDEEARIDEQITIGVDEQKYLKPLNKIASDFAEEFNVKVKIKY